MPQTVLAIGAHIGDMDLTAGPALAQAALDQTAVHMLACTAGEAGHPRMSPSAYKVQKLEEGHAFATAIGGSLHVLDVPDGYLAASDQTALQVAAIIRDLKPDTVIAHWKNSFHSDHRNASQLADRARYLAGLPTDSDTAPHHVRQVLFAENWEDAEGFSPTVYAEVSDTAFRTWSEAIAGESFARGETYGFRYIDFYTAQLVTRGCLAGVPHAVAFSQPREVNASPKDIWA